MLFISIMGYRRHRQNIVLCVCVCALLLLTLPSDADVGTVCLAASRGLQRFTVVLLMMNGLASPRGISANPVRVQMTSVFCIMEN